MRRKINLTTAENLGPAAFPIGALRSVPPADREAMLLDPAGYFGAPYQKANPDGTEVTIDPCPGGWRGFAAFPAVDLAAPLGWLEQPGAAGPETVDMAARRVTFTTARIAPSAATVAGHLDALEAELHRVIDRRAGERRKDFITDIPGQEATYLRKESQARAIIESGAAPSAADHGFIWVAAKRQAADPADPVEVAGLCAPVAQVIVARANAWLAIGEAIEDVREAAKAAVTAAKAGGDAAAEAAMEAAGDIDWSAIGGA